MFIGFVLVDFFVQRLEARRAAAAAPADRLWNVPQGFYLSESHTWFRPDASSGVRVGADALVAHALGAVEKVVAPKLGAMVEAGQPLFYLENHGSGLEIDGSITGQVVAVNSNLESRPQLVAKDPYGSGWICAITPSKPADTDAGLRSGAKAAAWLEQEFHRLREFLSLQVAPDLALSATRLDGGLPTVGSLTHLPPEGWCAFEEEFLRPRRTPPAP
jgi:glycine cleavage system H protein